MTRLIIITALLTGCYSRGYGQTHSSDSLAIIQLLDDEMNTYSKKSMAETVQQYWLLDEYTTAILSMPDGTCFKLNRETMLANTAVPPPSTVQIKRSNIRMNITGDHAFVNYQQLLINKEVGIESRSHELVILKRVSGVWKKHYFSGHYL